MFSNLHILIRIPLQNSTGTITEEHIRASLMSAIEDKIRRKINEQTVLCQDEVEILLQTQRELNQGKNKLDTMFDNLEKEKVAQHLSMIINRLKFYNSLLDVITAKYRAKSTIIEGKRSRTGKNHRKIINRRRRWCWWCCNYNNAVIQTVCDTWIIIYMCTWNEIFIGYFFVNGFHHSEFTFSEFWIHIAKMLLLKTQFIISEKLWEGEWLIWMCLSSNYVIYLVKDWCSGRCWKNAESKLALQWHRMQV